jgi:hypothetical protein
MKNSADNAWKKKAVSITAVPSKQISQAVNNTAFSGRLKHGEQSGI